MVVFAGQPKTVAVRRGSTVLFNNNFVLIHVLLTDACPLVLFSCESDLQQNVAKIKSKTGKSLNSCLKIPPSNKGLN